MLSFFAEICQDDTDKIISRAMEYKTPKDELRAFHYACSSAFGEKLPIFSSEQLSLCDDKTLLMFRSREPHVEEDDIFMFLQSVDDDGALNISLQHDDEDTHSYTQEELFNYTGGGYDVYYYPNSPLTSLAREALILREKSSYVGKKGSRKIFKKGVQLGFREGIKTAASSGKLITPNAAKSVGTATVPLLDAGLNSGFAGVSTYKARKKENEYEESGGLTGFSRTQANKEITTAWGKAASGTAGTVGSAALLTGVGAAAILGQVNDIILTYK